MYIPENMKKAFVFWGFFRGIVKAYWDQKNCCILSPSFLKSFVHCASLLHESVRKVLVLWKV